MSEILYLYNLKEGLEAKPIGVCKAHMQGDKLSIQIDVKVDGSEQFFEEQKKAYFQLGSLEIGNEKRTELQRAGEQKEIRRDEEKSEETREKIEAAQVKKKDENPQITDLFQLKRINEEWDHFRQNTFLLHGFYNYGHIYATKDMLAVPGNYYDREKQVAAMFGFVEFVLAGELNQEKQLGQEIHDGDYGYYVRRITESK